MALQEHGDADLGGFEAVRDADGGRKKERKEGVGGY